MTSAANHRIIRYHDGRIDLIGPIQDVMEWYEDSTQISNETAIVWRERIEDLPFVRVGFAASCYTSRNPLRLEGGRLIYAVLHRFAPADPRTGQYTRRVFYLKDSDAEYASSCILGNITNLVRPTEIRPGIPATEITAETLLDILQFADRDPVISWIDDEDDETDLWKKLKHNRQTDRICNNDRTGSELVPADGRPAIPLLYNELNVGRHRECEIVLPYRNISAVHCRLTKELGHWFVRDLNSANGVIVDGSRIPADKRIRLDRNVAVVFANHAYRIKYWPEGKRPPKSLD